MKSNTVDVGRIPSRVNSVHGSEKNSERQGSRLGEVMPASGNNTDDGAEHNTSNW